VPQFIQLKTLFCPEIRIPIKNPKIKQNRVLYRKIYDKSQVQNNIFSVYKDSDTGHRKSKSLFGNFFVSFRSVEARTALNQVFFLFHSVQAEHKVVAGAATRCGSGSTNTMCLFPGSGFAAKLFEEAVPFSRVQVTPFSPLS
jgi:hypothetical protein